MPRQVWIVQQKPEVLSVSTQVPIAQVGDLVQQRLGGRP